MDKSAVAKAFAEAKVALTSIGFKKRSEEIYTQPITNDVIGWVGLNRKARKDGVLEINPVVGVRHQAVEHLVADLNGDTFHPYIPPTLSSHLGYLRGDNYTPIMIDSVANITHAILLLMAAIESDALAFMQRCVPIAELARALQTSRHTVPEQAAYRVPVALYLANDHVAARAVLASRLGAQAGRSDPAATKYSAFVARFSERLL